MAHQPMTCIPISVQDRLAKLEQQLRDDHERNIEQRLNGGRYGPPPPPPGKIGILATDLDQTGRKYATRWTNEKGQIRKDWLLIGEDK